MVAVEWSARVGLETMNGEPLGEATLRLRRSPQTGREDRWNGELVGTICGGATNWPAGQPVRLRLRGGEEIAVALETGLMELGPALMQVAHVRADAEELARFVRRTIN